jgi:hypothetical protein
MITSKLTPYEMQYQISMEIFDEFKKIYEMYEEEKMKVKEVTKDAKEFEPFEIMLTIEKEEEANLLLLLLNEQELRKILLKSYGEIKANILTQNHKIASKFDYKTTNELYRIILKHLSSELCFK